MMKWKPNAKTWLHLVALATGIVHFVKSNELECKVLVEEPWPMQYLAVPQDSTVEMNCSANPGGSSFWAVDLGNDSAAVQYQFGVRGDFLNSHGFYELSQIETPGMTTLRLLINDTSAANNQTTILCRINAQRALSTTLFIFNQSQLEMSIQDTGLNSVSITWSRATVDVGQIFTLEISHRSELITSISLNESYYNFTAPEGSAPCEVYNFSVTATYIGARYIGAGCSASSPVLSRMLPSLPDIKGLERSLKHSIAIEQLSQDIILNVSFEPASDCEQYSVSYYSLEIQGPLPGTTVQSFIVENFTATNTIPKNAVYNFTIIVSNSIGNISTKSRTFYTTDVQMVEVTLKEDSSQDASIHCEFIVGSKATGCMVVLTREQRREEYRLTRNTITNSAILRVTLRHVVSSYVDIEAFDVEFDGSIGSVAVPGMFRKVDLPENVARSFVLKEMILMNIVFFMISTINL